MKVDVTETKTELLKALRKEASAELERREAAVARAAAANDAAAAAGPALASAATATSNAAAATTAAATSDAAAATASASDAAAASAASPAAASPAVAAAASPVVAVDVAAAASPAADADADAASPAGAPRVQGKRLGRCGLADACATTSLSHLSLPRRWPVRRGWSPHAPGWQRLSNPPTRRDLVHVRSNRGVTKAAAKLRARVGHAPTRAANFLRHPLVPAKGIALGG